MPRNWLLAVAALAFLLRLGYAAATGALRHPQTWEQESIATNLLERHEFVFEHMGAPYRAYAEPLYPFAAAAVYAVTDHSLTAMVLLQILVSAITAWLTGRLAARATGDERAGVAAALLFAVDPGLIRYSSVLHPLTFDTFFFAAAALALVARRWLLAGTLIGLGALTRPTILLLSLFQRRIVIVALTLALALAIVAPWTIRNAVVLHEFVLTRSGTGFVFWLGNNPNTTGGATDARGRPLFADAPPAFRAQVRAAGELERDRLFRDAARDYVAAHPLAAAGRVLERLYFFWWFSPVMRVNLVYRIWWGFLLLSAALGAAMTRRRDVWLLVAMALAVSLLQSLYYVEGRHRLSVEPLIFPAAALSLMIAAPRCLPFLRPRSRS